MSFFFGERMGYNMILRAGGYRIRPYGLLYNFILVNVGEHSICSRINVMSSTPRSKRKDNKSIETDTAVGGGVPPHDIKNDIKTGGETPPVRVCDVLEFKDCKLISLSRHSPVSLI